MKTKHTATVLLILCIFLGSCSKAEVLPGTYMSNDPANFPFPIAGYAVYVVGEIHGNHETKQVFSVYMQRLYKEAGLRDVVLEEDQAYETDANAYVQGSTDQVPNGLCLRADILGQIRDFNRTLPENEKVIVHLVDVDSPFSLIYRHLIDLRTQLGSKAADIKIPPLSEFENWSPKQIYDLIAELQNEATDQPDILHELETVHLSFRWYFIGNDMDAGTGSRKNFFPLREDIITQNMQYLLSQLNGKPVLAFFGTMHAMKVMGIPNPPTKDMKSWTERLLASGVSVYSLSIEGYSGNGLWRGESFPYGEGISEYKFQNNTSLVSLFETHPDADIIYTDLRTEENRNIKLSSAYLNKPASQVYDGLIIFKEFTPMENTCQQ